MSLHVGTSGWAYREWKPDFYPQDLPQKRFLEYYGSVLTACEINATFYRRQEDSTFERWAASTPETFRFATKAHRGLTHARRPVFDEARASFFSEFLTSVERLGEKLGAVLFQFPPSLKRDDEHLDHLLEHIAGKAPFALEFRDPSWDADDVRKRAADAGGTICVGHVEGPPPNDLPPGPLAYVRMRDQDYGPERREGWRALFLREAQERPVFVFTKHEGTPANDPFAGVGLARWLTETMRSEAS
jgi:uncharacterized protein YecE (DUF72 family)